MQDEIIARLKEDFQKTKQGLGFTASFEELDDIFFMQDYFLKEGYVSNKLSRAICRRIVDLYMSWVGYLHSIVMPTPHSMINMTEHSMFTDEEKNDILKLMNTILAFSSSNSVIGLTKDRKQEAEFIDNSVKLWHESIKPELTKIMDKVNKSWIDRSNGIGISD